LAHGQTDSTDLAAGSAGAKENAFGGKPEAARETAPGRQDEAAGMADKRSGEAGIGDTARRDSARDAVTSETNEIAPPAAHSDSRAGADTSPGSDQADAGSGIGDLAELGSETPSLDGSDPADPGAGGTGTTADPGAAAGSDFESDATAGLDT